MNEKSDCVRAFKQAQKCIASADAVGLVDLLKESRRARAERAAEAIAKDLMRDAG